MPRVTSPQSPSRNVVSSEIAAVPLGQYSARSTCLVGTNPHRKNDFIVDTGLAADSGAISKRMEWQPVRTAERIRIGSIFLIVTFTLGVLEMGIRSELVGPCGAPLCGAGWNQSGY
jgi:hypothetical protein